MSLVEADMLYVEAADAVIDSLGACVDSNLLELSGTKYNFAHDQIQASSFRLFSEDELPKIQLTIGRGLVNHSGGGEKEEDRLFLSVDLCNSGRSLITDDTGRISLAFQNLKAAEKAIHKSSAFDAGIAYAESALQCLDPEPAAEKDVVKYLRLKLHTALAEASYCTGDRRATAVYSEKVINSDFPFADRFAGYSTRMMSQFAQAQMDESMETSLYILKKLGYIKNLATYPGTLRILIEIVKTRSFMKSFTQEDLLNLPPMTDENRLRGMNIVYRTATISHSTNPNVFLILFLTAMRWTVKYGVCKYSPPIFAVYYGLVICGVLEDFDNGNMIGEVALALSERLQATQTVALTTSVVFAFVNHWKNDLRTARKPLEYGYLTGLQMGDINNAFINLISLDQNSWLSACQDLPELERNIRASVSKIRSYDHEYFAVEHCITWQFILNLLGRCDDPLIMTGEAMDQEESFKTAIETNHKMVIVATNSFSGIVGYLYKNYDHAVAKMKLVKKEDCLGYWTLPRHFSMLALAYIIALAQEGKRAKRNLAQARGVMKMLKRWVQKGNPNLAHLLCLMDAEVAAVLKPDSAAAIYEIAIKVATRAGCRHDKALAHHRAARFFFVVKNDEHWGSYHIDKPIQAYCEWGALGVAKHLAKNYMTSEGGTSCTFSQEITMSDRTKGVLSSIDTR
jgi:predicted ATPase